MNPRISLFVWVLFLHFIILGGVYVQFGRQPVVFFGVEAVVLISLVFMSLAFRRITRPMRQISESINRLDESDFSARLQLTGDVLTDRLVLFYNRMMEQLRSERAHIRSQHHFLDLLVKATPLGIVILDFDHRISEANPAACKFLGLTDQEIAGMIPSDIEGPLAHTMATLIPGRAETVRVDGIRQFSLLKMMFTDRGFQHPFIMIEELTDEINRAEKESYTRIIRMMSHEVNNTVGAINSIMGSVNDYLSEQFPGAGSYRDALDVAISRNENMNRFMANFAGLVKIPQPVFSPCDLNELMKKLVFVADSWSTPRKIKIETQFTNPLPLIEADVTLLEQAFINALKNAVEASEDEGFVSIKTYADPVRMVISNTGQIITPEIQQKLFTPFYSTKPSGQGIGLMLIREILTRHNLGFSLQTVDGITEFRVIFNS